MTPTPAAQEVVVPLYGFTIKGPLKDFFETVTNTDWDAFMSTVGFWWNVYSVIAILFSLACFVGFIYAKIRYDQLYGTEMEALKEAEARWAARHEGRAAKNSRWDAILVRVSENNPESWRVAIIEADILLDETLTNAGYVGKSLGEKLKSANPQSMKTIQDAWEAHKVRNEIAHVGSDFVLTKKTAQETIVQFERVFREFGVI